MRNENLIGITICAVILSPLFYQIVIVLKEIKKGKKINWKRIKKIILLFFSFAIFSCGIVLLLNRVNFLNYKRPMTYDTISQISLNDFRGLEFFKKSLYLALCQKPFSNGVIMRSNKRGLFSRS